MEAFISHGPMTSPGRHSLAIEALPDDVSSLLATIRGLLVHGSSPELYGLGADAPPSRSRETLSLERRLSQIFEKSGEPLSVARPVRLREVGTCRDYAVMTCGVLRQRSVPARVRCGFARYFLPGRFEDHWIFEYWHVGEERWARADAQLDYQHCNHLGISFSTSDLPDGEFLTAHEAWHLVRDGEIDPELFGHGDAAGEWFLWVNLARDHFSLKGQETSPWDNWRHAIGSKPNLTAQDRTSCDQIASSIMTLERHDRAPLAVLRLQPFWLRGDGDLRG